MANHDMDDAKILAANLLKDASEQLQQRAEDERRRALFQAGAARLKAPSVELSNVQLKNLVDAVEQELCHSSEKAAADEARLAKMEAQTSVLAHAVIAMTEASETVAPALRSLKAEMLEHESSPTPADSSAPKVP